MNEDNEPDDAPGRNVKVQCWKCGQIYVTAEADEYTCCKCGQEGISETLE